MRLFRVLWSCHVFWYQTNQRTFGATVRLLRWQLNLDDVSFRHFYFVLSGDLHSDVCNAFSVVSLFRGIPVYSDNGKTYLAFYSKSTDKRGRGFRNIFDRRLNEAGRVFFLIVDPSDSTLQFFFPSLQAIALTLKVCCLCVASGLTMYALMAWDTQRLKIRWVEAQRLHLLWCACRLYGCLVMDVDGTGHVAFSLT